MGWNVRRSWKIAPGLRLTASKRGLGMSVGTRGLHVSRSATGRTTFSAGLPGTGLSYRETLPDGQYSATSPAPDEDDAPIAVTAQPAPSRALSVAQWTLAGLFTVTGVVLMLSTRSSTVTGALCLALGSYALGRLSRRRAGGASGV